MFIIGKTVANNHETAITLINILIVLPFIYIYTHIHIHPKVSYILYLTLYSLIFYILKYHEHFLH